MRMRKSEMRMPQSDKKPLAFEYEFSLSVWLTCNIPILDIHTSFKWTTIILAPIPWALSEWGQTTVWDDPLLFWVSLWPSNMARYNSSGKPDSSGTQAQGLYVTLNHGVLKRKRYFQHWVMSCSHSIQTQRHCSAIKRSCRAFSEDQ